MALELLEQTTLDIDGTEYLVTAMTTTQLLQFMEAHQEELDKGKDDLSLRKKVICWTVSKDNQPITEKRFDTVFSRKYKHMTKLYLAVAAWNLPDFFEEPGTEE